MSESEKKNIRLLIVDDQALFRKGVARLLQSEPGFEVVGDCGSGKEALRIIRSLSGEIDLVLLDLDLGKERGTDLLDWLQRAHFGGRVLLVTASVSDREAFDLIRGGIAGIFMKQQSPALLIQGIRDIVEGKASLDEDLLRRALKQIPARCGEQTHSALTDRERQVLSFLLEGLANKQIGSPTRFRGDREILSAAALCENWCTNTKPARPSRARAIPGSTLSWHTRRTAG
jgi:two-component system, NarL family, nitrate/nitrite response regulator NarL